MRWLTCAVGFLCLTGLLAFDSRSDTTSHALLVGVARYPDGCGFPSLQGPVHDVRLLASVLTSRFGFLDTNITRLVDGQTTPTRAAIERAFRDLARKVRKGDRVVILLSGHGSQQPDQDPPDPDDPEPDGLDEVFLPADTGPRDLTRKVIPGAILDDELRVWLKALTSKGAQVFFIADCCHAGTITRGEDTDGLRGKSASEIWPAEVLAAARARGKVTALPASPLKLSDAGSLVALYACQPDERTREDTFPAHGVPGAHRAGILTYALCDLLTTTTAPVTYRELASRIPGVYLGWNRTWRLPTPFAEGADLDREVLGEKRWPGRSVLRLTGEKGAWQVTGGQLAGLHPGTVLAIFPPVGEKGETRPLGHVRVREATALTSSVEQCPFGELPPLVSAPEDARAEIVSRTFSLNKVAVWLDPTIAREQRESLTAVIERGQASKVDRADQAGWAVRPSGGKVWLLPARADPGIASPVRFELSTEDPAKELSTLLERIGRAGNLLAVASRAEEDRSEDLGIEVEVRLLAGPEDREGKPVHADQRGLRLHGGDRVRYRVTNHGKKPVDVTLLTLTADLRLYAILPERKKWIDNRVLPGKSVWTEPLEMDDSVLGTEHAIVVAVESRGPQVDFTWLEDRHRGGWSKTDRAAAETPVGQMLHYAWCQAGQVRGLAPRTGCRMRVLTWRTVGRGE